MTKHELINKIREITGEEEKNWLELKAIKLFINGQEEILCKHTGELIYLIDIVFEEKDKYKTGFYKIRKKDIIPQEEYNSPIGYFDVCLSAGQWDVFDASGNTFYIEIDNVKPL